MVKLKKQKVRFRRKKQDSSAKPPVKFNFKAFIKFFMAIVLVGAIGIGLASLKYAFLNTDYFMVKNIEADLYDAGSSSRRISLTESDGHDIVGTNIFFVDLNLFKNRIEASHPEFKGTVIRRMLPNKLIVEAALRKAVAQISSDRYYFVDKEGVVLPDVKNFPDPAFPIISGVGANLAKVQASSFSELDKEKVDKALSIIQKMQATEGLSGYRLKSIDTTDPGNLSFFLEGANVEIKIGKSDFSERLKLLVTVLEQIGTDMDKFKYIDLRFEDPIIGPR